MANGHLNVGVQTVMTNPKRLLPIFGLAAMAGILSAPQVRAEEVAKQPDAATATERLPLVSVVTAAARDLAANVVVSGNLVAREEINVGTDIDGLKIIEINVDIGDVVKAGQVLARLDRSSLDIQLAQNAANIANAEAAIAQSQDQIDQANASLVQIQASYDRTKALAEKGFASQDVLDQSTSAFTRAKSQLSAAQNALAASKAQKASLIAARDTINLNIARTEIKAVSGGLVLTRNAKIGAIAASSAGALFTLARNGEVELEAQVPENSLPRIKPGMPVAVTQDGDTKTASGVVRLVSPKVDTTTRLGLVRVALPDNAGFRVGSFANARVETARSHGVSVPLSSVLFGVDKSTVQVVKDGKIETRDVKTGIVTLDYVEVLSGVSEGETVVERAGVFVRNGDRVNTAKSSEEAKG